MRRTDAVGDDRIVGLAQRFEFGRALHQLPLLRRFVAFVILDRPKDAGIGRAEIRLPQVEDADPLVAVAQRELGRRAVDDDVLPFPAEVLAASRRSRH